MNNKYPLNARLELLTYFLDRFQKPKAQLEAYSWL